MRSDSPPRYIQIFVTLRDRIVTGVYPVGDRGADRGRTQRGSSRLALHRARGAAPAGGFRVVDGARGRATRSSPARRGPTTCKSMGSLSDLFQYALDTHFEISTVATEALDGADAEDVGVEPRFALGPDRGACACRRAAARRSAPPPCSSPHASGRSCSTWSARACRSTRSWKAAPARRSSRRCEEVTARRLPRRMTRQLDECPRARSRCACCAATSGRNGLPMVRSRSTGTADSYTYTSAHERGGLMG